jgi:hypothetical protein
MKRLLRFGLLAAAVVVLIAGAVAISPNPRFQGEISSLHPPAKPVNIKRAATSHFWSNAVKFMPLFEPVDVLAAAGSDGKRSARGKLDR